jgi:putative adenylate-forming enzyme
MSAALTMIRVIWKRTKLERSCRWPRTRLNAHQASRIAELRRFSLERSPFYRRFHKGLENRPFEELPILTKATMMESFDDLITDRTIHLADVEEWFKAGPGTNLFRGRYVVLSTSGSTGRRGVFLFNDKEWIAVLANIIRPMIWAGVNRSFRKPLRTAVIASQTPWHYSARVGASLSSALLPALYLDAGDRVENIVRRLNEWQPEVMGAYPSVLRQLTEEQLEGRLRIRPQTISSAAEVLTPEIRRRVQQAWNTRVYDTYGTTEYSPIAAECPFGRKHLIEDGAVIEIVDEDGRPTPPGERGDRVLVSVFDRWTQPLIRYEISDVLRPLAEECECGRPFRLVDSIEGRREDTLTFPARSVGAEFVSLHPKLFYEVLEIVPAAGWQVVQDDGRVTVNLLGLKDSSICISIRDQLWELFGRQGAEVAAIDVREVQALVRGATGKAPLVMSRSSKTQ